MNILKDLELRKFLREIKLEKGAHSPDHTFCVMEAVAFVAGEKWSDHPQCASVVIGDFLRSWNDALSDEDRQILKPLIPKLVGTKADDAIEHKRSWMALDWYCRVNAPAWLELAGLRAEAKAIRATAAIVDVKSARVAQQSLDRAKSAAVAARAAARAAAGDAAETRAAARAAWAAARAAAGDAAETGAAARAAWAAAEAAAEAADAAEAAAAARAAARAAGAAAGAALRPTVIKLQKSAIQLVERMIAT